MRVEEDALACDEGEYHVMILKALDEEKQEKTIVLVSHRPSTLRICDVCMKADFGRKRR